MCLLLIDLVKPLGKHCLRKQFTTFPHGKCLDHVNQFKQQRCLLEFWDHFTKLLASDKIYANGLLEFNICSSLDVPENGIIKTELDFIVSPR